MLGRIKHWIRNYFGSSKAETNGFVILVFLMLLVFISLSVYEHAISPTIDLSADHAQLEQLVLEMEKSAASMEKEVATTPLLADMHAFDPNIATATTLIQMGIPAHIAARLIKYRESGGKFRTKNDLMKIYGFRVQDFERLLPYIDLPENLPEFKKKEFVPFSSEEKEPIALMFDVNRADTAQLKKINGIGAVLSSRIIKYRDLLGGFIDKQQYQEVYGLSDEVVEKLNKSTQIEDNFQQQLINVNKASAEDLAAHPYINYKLAKVIVAYRSQHGLFLDLEDLKNIKLVGENEYNKISPYLTL